MTASALKSWADVGLRVAKAREVAGLSQQELADRVGLSPASFAEVERGRRELAVDELARISDATKQPFEWFVLESPPGVVSRRDELEGEGSSAQADLLVDRVARSVEFLHDLGFLTPPEEIPQIRAPENFQEAERAAQKVRGILGSPEGPLLDLQGAAERLGLWAFALPLQSVTP